MTGKHRDDFVIWLRGQADAIDEATMTPDEAVSAYDANGALYVVIAFEERPPNDPLDVHLLRGSGPRSEMLERLGVAIVEIVPHVQKVESEL